jgi:hypothetical protein
VPILLPYNKRVGNFTFVIATHTLFSSMNKELVRSIRRVIINTIKHSGTFCLSEGRFHQSQSQITISFSMTHLSKNISPWTSFTFKAILNLSLIVRFLHDHVLVLAHLVFKILFVGDDIFDYAFLLIKMM